jgi:hypothetical protein
MSSFDLAQDMLRSPQGGEIPKTYARQVNVLGISPSGRYTESNKQK